MANGADIPSHARLVLVLALFFEFFFFPLDFMVLFLGSLLYARGKATTISREYVKVIMGN